MPPKALVPQSDSDDEMPMNMEAMRANYALRLCPSEYARLLVDGLPADKQRIVKGLQGNQAEIDQILVERALAVEEIRRNFQIKLQPLFDRRSALVAGAAAPTDAEVSAAFADENVGGTELPAEHPLAGSTQFRAEIAASRGANIAKGPGLNGFWLEALRNHDFLEQLISEKDTAILEHLIDVSTVHLAPPRLGFAVRYVFGPNPAIKSVDIARKGPVPNEVESGPCPAAKAATEAVIAAGAVPQDELAAGVTVPEGGFLLTKVYYLAVDQDGDPFVNAIDGTEIVWNESQNPTVEIKEKKQTRGKGKAKQTRVVQYEEEVPSFFNIFKALTPDAEGEDEDESPFDRDHELGRLIGHSIVPRAVEWFTARGAGPSSPFDDEEDMDGMGMGEDSDDEADPATGKSKNAAPGAPQQECKQQ